MDRRVAFVTGASRGIGKACAVHLARAGFDVAVLARTAVDGEAREHSSTVARSDTTPLPGSLATTAALIRAAVRHALRCVGDLLDRASLRAAATTVLERWGRVVLKLLGKRAELPGRSQQPGVQEIKERPEIRQAVLDGSARHGDPCAGGQFLRGARLLGA